MAQIYSTLPYQNQKNFAYCAGMKVSGIFRSFRKWSLDLTIHEIDAYPLSIGDLGGDGPPSSLTCNAEPKIGKEVQSIGEIFLEMRQNLPKSM